MPPFGTSALELGDPFIDRVAVAHTPIAARANWDKVVKSRLATLALGNVMAAFVVEHRDAIRTPRDAALALEPVAEDSDPDLLGESLGDLLLFIRRFGRKVAELHSPVTGCRLYID